MELVSSTYWVQIDIHYLLPNEEMENNTKWMSFHRNPFFALSIFMNLLFTKLILLNHLQL